MGMNFNSVVPLPPDVDLKQYRIRGVRNAEGKIVRYTDQDIETAATVYFLTGTAKATAEVLDISTSAIGKWLDHDIWIATITRLRRQHTDTLDVKLSYIINLAYDGVVDRLQNGDEVVTKDGTKVRKKMSGRDAAWIGSVLFDKRQIGRKLPTKIQEAGNTDEKLNQIAQRLADMAAAQQQHLPPVDVTPRGAPIDIQPDDAEQRPTPARRPKPGEGIRPIAPSLTMEPDFEPVAPPAEGEYTPFGGDIDDLI